MSDSHSTQNGVTPGQYRVGGAIVLTLDLQLLRASSVAIAIFSPTSSTPIIPGSFALVPSESVVIQIPSGRGSRILTTTSVGSLADFQSGRSYLLDAPSFPATMVDVVDVNADSQPYTLQLADQLSNAVPANAMLLGTLATYAATNANLPRARGYRARWTVTALNGDKSEFVQSFDVVFQPFEILITRQDVESAWPGVGLSLDDNWRALVNGAIDAIQGELDAQGLEPDRVRNTRPWKQAAVYFICRAIVTGKAGSDRGWEKLWERFDQLYTRAVNQAMNSSRVWYDAQDEDERADADERPPAHFWAAKYDDVGDLVVPD